MGLDRAEEIAIPINYAQLWALVRRHGGSERDALAARACGTSALSYFRAYLRSGAGAAAWTNVDAEEQAHRQTPEDRRGRLTPKER
ncbi:MAG: hypothetical protein R3F65_33230 [bacterium]